MNSSNIQPFHKLKPAILGKFRESFVSVCKQCNKRIYSGDFISHLQNGQVVHLHCKQIANTLIN